MAGWIRGLLMPLLITCCFGLAYTKEYWVKPTSGYSCSQKQPCLTLSEYIQNTTAYFTSNTTFHFLPGTHEISSDGQVVVSEVQNLSLIGIVNNHEPSPNASIFCKGRTGFTFWNIHNLHMYGLEIENCGTELLNEVIIDEPNVVLQTNYLSLFSNKLLSGLLPKQLPNTTKAALYLTNVHSPVLHHVHVKNSNGYGLLAINIHGNATVTACKFLYNYGRRNSSNRESVNDPSGNALFIWNFEISGKFKLNVFNSEFAHGICMPATKPPPIESWEKLEAMLLGESSEFKYFGGCGLAIIAVGGDYTTISLVIHNSTFHNNTAPLAGNMLLSLSGAQFMQVFLDMQTCQFHNGRVTADGGGLYIYGGYVSPFLFRKLSKGLTTKTSLFNFLWGFLNPIRDPIHSMFLPHLTIYMSNTEFSNNRAYMGGAIFAASLYVPYSVHISNCIFSNNSAKEGGAIAMASVSMSKFLVTNTLFHNNHATETGGGVHIHEDENVIANMFLTFINSQFLDEVVNYSYIHFTRFENCSFIANIAKTGSAMVNDQGKHVLTALYLSNVKFYRNTDDADCAVVVLIGIRKALIQNSIFENNNCTSMVITNSTAFYQEVTFTANKGNQAGAIFASGSSTLYFNGTANFSNNEAYTGGALMLSNSQLYLKFNTTLYIINNTAQEYGGAIAVGDDCTNIATNQYQCFFQTENCTNFTCNAAIVMENNTANIAGDSIYGGCLATCYLQISKEKLLPLKPQLFDNIFNITGPHSQSEIAGVALIVCFCNDTSVGNECPVVSQVRVVKGQIFQVKVFGTAYANYASPALIHTRIAPGFSGELGEGQTFQQVSSNCEDLMYSIQTLKEYIELELFVEHSNKPPVTLEVFILPCPVGFQLTQDSQTCDCAAHLRKPGVVCRVENETIYRPALMWIGKYSEEVAIHTNCPFDYCVPQGGWITLSDQDKQCAFNHSGILCGGCQPGLSSMLGSSQCKKCSNFYLFLLVPFALVGLILVILLMVCNLTVSTGTLNGLIFYANIVRVNHTVFIPLGKTSPIMQILSLFIAWLNLDLGIETCFFDGMDAFSKTWLQFIFPIYIWSLVGLLIIASKYSVSLSKLSGSNTVSVLATLFLLSYAKLLRTVIAAASFTRLTIKEGYTPPVWLLDGNIHFLGWPHILLFLASLVALFTYVIPFTLLVFFTPFLQAWTNYRLMHWVTKFKPLIDAYTGPYKDKYRYWTGLMLLIRTALFIVFAGIALGDPRVNLFVISMVVALLLVLWIITRKVYRHLLVSLIEIFILFNLEIFSVATLFLRTSGEHSVKKQEAVTYTMVGTAFATFCGIVAYQCYKEFKTTALFTLTTARYQWIQSHFMRQQESEQTGESTLSDDGGASQPIPPTASVIELHELREPLMTD